MPERITGIILGRLPEGQSTSKVLEAILRVCRIPVLEQYTLDALSAELGGPDNAGRWLIDKATELDRPIMLHGLVPRRSGGFVIVPATPRGWSDERILGYMGGLHEELGLLLGGEIEISMWDGKNKEAS